MSPSRHFEEVPSTHIGDKMLRRYWRHHGIFRLVYHAILRLIGKLRRR